MTDDRANLKSSGWTAMRLRRATIKTPKHAKQMRRRRFHDVGFVGLLGAGLEVGSDMRSLKLMRLSK